jgi:hypothetical protein
MHPLAPDLEHVLAYTAGVWDELRGARIFVTGGTGFVGCWLLESWAWAWERRGLHGSLTVLTRSADAFRRKAPRLASHPGIRLIEGDVRSFHLPTHASPVITRRPTPQHRQRPCWCWIPLWTAREGCWTSPCRRRESAPIHQFRRCLRPAAGHAPYPETMPAVPT